MKVNGRHFTTIWPKEGSNNKIICIIDQTKLPHKFEIAELKNLNDVIVAINDMKVRGADLIGVTAAYGIYLASLEAPKDNFDKFILDAGKRLKATRPTAINLAWAVDRQLEIIKTGKTVKEKTEIALKTANEIAEEDREFGRKIGENGLKIIEQLSKKKNNKVVNILTHCNAGWLALVDYGTATAPIYAAFDKGIKIHVWVDETRPRNQGASLTAWELGQHGVPHTVIVDNSGGHLMQHGMVDMVIVGSDRTTYTGDVANKIGTYLKALAAKDNNVPFYVALPSSAFDWNMKDGIKEIPIEERNPNEVKYVQGLCNGEMKKVLITPKNSNAVNYGFDVTPSRLITGLITERGICEANEKSILKMFPEYKNR